MTNALPPPAPPCEIRSIDTRRLLAYANVAGILLYSRHERRTYVLTWEEAEQIKREVEACQAPRITKFLC